MALGCVNHPDQAATFVVESPSAVKPYRKDVQLCDPCAARMAKIAPSWPMHALSASESGEAT